MMINDKTITYYICDIYLADAINENSVMQKNVRCVLLIINNFWGPVRAMYVPLTYVSRAVRTYTGKATRYVHMYVPTVYEYNT